jgi:YegS/Rv2252/BmrU family lipid kinase
MQVMPAVAFVINTNLAKASGRFLSLCRGAAARGGWTPEFALTDKGDAGITAASNAVASEADLVIAAGGDGTVRGCAQALADTGVPLGIIPLGTANILARTLGLPIQPGRALDAALSPKSRNRRIDLATAEIGDGDPAIGDRVLFTAMTGMGLDAAVVSGTRFKRRLGWLGYAFSGLAHLPDPPATYTIRLDSGEPITRSARCVIAGNSGLLPGGWTLIPEARVDDGLLDVGIMAPRGLLGWPRLTARVLMNHHVQDRQLERFRARDVEITAHRPLPREVDGEIVSAATTLRASVRPGALTVRVPSA